jgi:hypothetical protein
MLKSLATLAVMFCATQIPAKTGFDWATMLANYLLVGVGIVGICVAVKTLGKIERQTILQEIAYTQWIVVKNWRTEMMNEMKPMLRGDGSPIQRMRIRLEIVNESQFPLTLTDSVLAFNVRSDGNGNVRFYPPENFRLFPSVPYHIDVPIVLNKDEVVIFERGIIPVSIEGHFVYRGVLKKTERYHLQGMLWCGQSETTFDAEIPNRPDGADLDDGSLNPN